MIDMLNMRKWMLSLIAFLCATNVAIASDHNAEKIIMIYVFSDAGKPSMKIGEIKAKDTSEGLLLIPDLKNLSPGIHGFHLHQNPSCDNFGNDAGAHYDPNRTSHHLGPTSLHGHKGDLPYLIVSADGKADPQHPVLAPRLSIEDIVDHAVVIHAGGDNYNDKPAPLGGGGPRIACGVIR